MPVNISVIVPVYNLEQELPRCLDSILAQTYGDLEIILVDDGSSDDSRGIMVDYAHRDSRIKTIFKENGGVTSARLRGVEEASGEWIGFVDGDDEIEPEMYERLLANALEHKAQISHCGYQMVFMDGRVNYFHNTGVTEVHDRTRALRELLSGQRIEPGLCNKLFRKNLFQGWSMDESIKINEDLLMNYYLFSNAETTIFDDWCPYHYIVRNASASRSRLNEHKIYDPVRVKERILADVCDELRCDAQRAFVSTCVYTYCGLVLERDYPTIQAKCELRKRLKGHNTWLNLLPRRTKMLAVLILKMPVLLELVYPIYVRFFQKSQYN